MSSQINEQESIKKLRQLADLLDSRFTGPYGFRFGIDGILGLIPGVGDLVTTGLSVFILSQAAALGCPPATLMRMAFNIALENILDTIPLLGNIFDFLWKSNTKNLFLLESYLRNPVREKQKNRLAVALIFLGLFSLIILSGTATFYILRGIYHMITNT